MAIVTSSVLSLRAPISQDISKSLDQIFRRAASSSATL
jgi:hypothetical protein